MKKHLETLKFPSEEFTLSISLALAECFNIQSEYTIEKYIWNSSLKIKEGKQSGKGVERNVIRNADLHRELSLCNGTGLISNLSLQYINIAVLARD